MLSKLCWYFWQLFPCTYRTYYGDEAGRLHFTVWKMWLCRCYNTEDVTVDTVRHRTRRPDASVEGAACVV